MFNLLNVIIKTKQVFSSEVITLPFSHGAILPLTARLRVCFLQEPNCTLRPGPGRPGLTGTPLLSTPSPLHGGLGAPRGRAAPHRPGEDERWPLPAAWLPGPILPLQTPLLETAAHSRARTGAFVCPGKSRCRPLGPVHPGASQVVGRSQRRALQMPEAEGAASPRAPWFLAFGACSLLGVTVTAQSVVPPSLGSSLGWDTSQQDKGFEVGGQAGPPELLN